MFSSSIEGIKNAIIGYIGSGMYVALFCIALLYIFIKEENKNIKLFFGWFSIIILIIILNPIFSIIVGKAFTSTTYWRMSFMLPLGMTLAYAAVKIINDQEKILYKYIVGFLLILIIMISGKFIYNSSNYAKVNNAYKIPDEALHISYVLKDEDRINKKAMVPPTLVPYIRQITGEVELMYARNPEGYKDNELVNKAYAGDVKYIVDQCKEKNCEYIIFEKSTILQDSLDKYNYELFEQTENYDLYRLKK